MVNENENSYIEYFQCIHTHLHTTITSYKQHSVADWSFSCISTENNGAVFPCRIIEKHYFSCVRNGKIGIVPKRGTLTWSPTKTKPKHEDTKKFLFPHKCTKHGNLPNRLYSLSILWISQFTNLLNSRPCSSSRHKERLRDQPKGRLKPENAQEKLVVFPFGLDIP